MRHTLTSDQLLAMYDTYRALSEEIEKLERTHAKLLLTGQDATATKQALYSVNQKRTELADAMTFDTPRIWIEYKYRAYQNESQPIATLHDLRLHCSKPDYVCTKRYRFLNDELVAQHKPPLSDRSVYPDTMNIGDLLSSDALDTLPESSYEQWRSHEYHHRDGMIAKWRDYSATQL